MKKVGQCYPIWIVWLIKASGISTLPFMQFIAYGSKSSVATKLQKVFTTVVRTPEAYIAHIYIKIISSKILNVSCAQIGFDLPIVFLTLIGF